MNRPVRTPLTPPAAPGFTRKRMAKAFASFGDDHDGINKKVTEKPAAQVQASAGLLDYDKENDKKATKPTVSVLQSPIWKNYKEQEPAKASIEAQVTNRLVEESSTTNSSVRDAQIQTVDSKASMKDAWTQTEDSFQTAKEKLLPTSATTDSSSDTHTLVDDESDSCQDDSSATSVSESVPATEVFTPEEDSVMEDVGESVESTKSEDIIQDPGQSTKIDENDPMSCERWFGTSFYARNLLSQDIVST